MGKYMAEKNNILYGREKLFLKNLFEIVFSV